MKSLEITVRTTLLGAANLIRERGWARRTMQTDQGAMCIRGAIRRYVAEASPKGADPVVCGNLIDDTERAMHERLLLDILPNGFLFNGVCIAVWNDVHCVSAAQAIAELEAAALEAV